MASTGIIYRLIAHDSASRTFDKIGRSARGTDSTLAKLGRTAKIAGEAVALGLAAGLAEGAKSAAKFQSEMTRISTQAGGTAKDVKVLSDQVLKLGTSTQQGPQHLAESLYHLKSVGMDNVQAMKALKESADLAAVGHANLEETTNALAGAWRTGIKGATSFHEAVSTVNAIIGAGNMSMDQFNAAIGTGILPSAKTFGLSMKQVGAALALMTDEGIDSASAATRLRMSFSLLGAPSKAAEKQLGKIGLTGLNLADAMRGPKGLIGAIGLLKEHLDKSGLSASKQSQLLSRAFGGGRSSSGILLMLNNLDVLEKKQEQINRSTGKFDDAVKMQRKTAEAQWHLLVSNLEVMGIRVGTKVLPPVTSFIHFLATDAMPAAARFGKAVGKIIPVDRIKSAVGEAKSVVSSFLGGFGGKGGIGDFFGGLTGAKVKAPAGPKRAIDKFPTTVLNPLDTPHLGSAQTSSTRGTGRAMQRLPHYGAGQVAPEAGRLGAPLAPMPHGGSGLSAPLIKVPKVPKAPKSLARQIGEQVRIAFTDGITHVNWDKFGPILGAGLGKGFGWLVSHGAELTKKLGQAIGKIDWVDVGKSVGVLAVPFAIGFINNLMEPLFHKDFWEKHWLDTILAVVAVIPFGKVFGAFGKLFGRIPWGKLGEVFGRIPWGKIIPFGEKLGELIPKFFGAIYNFVGKLVSKFGEAFASRFPKIAQWFSDQLILLPVRLEDLGRALIRKGREMITNLAKAIVEKVPGMGNRFLRAIAKMFGRFTLYQAGLNLAQSLISGAWSKLKSIGSWMKRHLVDPVVNWVKSGFGIASPSKVFTGIGGNLVAGLKGGVLAAAVAIGSWMWKHTGKPVVNAFKGAGSWLWGRGKALVVGLKNGVISGAAKIGVWTYRTVIKPSVDAFSGAGKWVWGKGRAFVGGLKDGAVSGAKGIGKWTSDHIISPVTSRFARAGSWLWKKGGQLVSGLKNGIVDKVKGIGKWIKSSFVDPIVGWVKKHFGINSPSRVFIGIGKSLTKGLVMGMAKTHPKEIAKRVFGSLPNALGGFLKHGLISAKNLGSKALKALGGLGGDLLGFLGLGDSGGGSSANQKIGEALAAARGWSGPQWAALKNLWNGESGWNATIENKSSGAYGIPQALPASKMASAGSDWKTSASTQIKWGLSYIASRYGNPINAYSAWLNRSPHWYAKGTDGAARGLAWVGERGPELVNFKGGEDVLSHPDSMQFAKANGIKLPGYASGTITNAADRVRRDRQKVEDAKDAVAAAKRRHKGVAAAEKRLKAAEKELQAANIALRNAQRSAKTSIANTIATGLVKTLGTGTVAAITSAIKSLSTKLLNAGFNKTAKMVMKQGDKLEKLATKRDSVRKTIAAANQYASDQAGNIKDFLSISGTSATSVGDLISQAGTQQKTASSFVALTKSLKARGASKDLLQQLSDAGPGSQLATILSAKGVTTTDIDKLNKLMSSGNKLATSFGKDMADLMFDSGKDAGKGFLAGLKAQEKALGKQMAKLATDLVKAIKKALRIKSPSGVFRDEVGKQVVLGMAHGIDMHGHLVGAATQRLADTATGVSIRRRYVPTAASGRNAGGHEEAWERLAAALENVQGSEVHVHFNDDRLRDLIDVQVKPKLKASEDRQAFRAKVGRR